MKIRSFAVAALLVVAPSLLAADFGIRAGQFRDTKDEFVGAEVVFDAGSLNINPNVEYSLADGTTAGSANLDFTVDIGKFSRVVPYLGAGLGLQYVDDNVGADETDVVGNLIGGLAFNLDFLKPYAQLKYVRPIEDDRGLDDFAVTIGLRF